MCRPTSIIKIRHIRCIFSYVPILVYVFTMLKFRRPIWTFLEEYTNKFISIYDEMNDFVLERNYIEYMYFLSILKLFLFIIFCIIYHRPVLTYWRLEEYWPSHGGKFSMVLFLSNNKSVTNFHAPDDHFNNQFLFSDARSQNIQCF